PRDRRPAHRDALRAQPDRGVAQPGRARRGRGLPRGGGGAGRLRRRPGGRGRPVTAQTWHAGSAHLPTGLARDVRLTVDGGRFTAVETDAPAQPGDHRLPGVVLPGLANAHSHAFHRALRGRTQDEGGTFWTWRER